MVSEDKYRRVVGRFGTPPAAPILSPVAPNQTEHVAAHHGGAAALHQLIARLDIGLVPGLPGVPVPFVKPQTVDPDRVIAVLSPAGDEPIKREDMWHVVKVMPLKTAGSLETHRRSAPNSADPASQSDVSSGTSTGTSPASFLPWNSGPDPPGPRFAPTAGRLLSLGLHKPARSLTPLSLRPGSGRVVDGARLPLSPKAVVSRCRHEPRPAAASGQKQRRCARVRSYGSQRSLLTLVPRAATIAFCDEAVA